MLLNRNCPNSSWLTVGIVYYHLLVVVHVFAGSTIVLLLAACSILVRDFACHSLVDLGCANHGTGLNLC